MCVWKNSCCSLQVGMEVAPQLKDNLNRNFFDLLGTFQQISGESVQNQLVVQRVELPEYLTLYSPAINWILQCIAYRAPEANVSSILTTFLKLRKRSDFSAKIKSMFFVVFIPVFVVGDDGEVQDPGQQVSVFETQEVNSVRTVTYSVSHDDVCVGPTVLCCWIQSWGHSDLSLLQPVPPISSAWLKTVTRPAFPRSDVKNQLFGFPHPWSLTLKRPAVVVTSPAPPFWLSGTQSCLCRPSWDREAEHSERSVEGGHQSAQSSGAVATLLASWRCLSLAVDVWPEVCSVFNSGLHQLCWNLGGVHMPTLYSERAE